MLCKVGQGREKNAEHDLRIMLPGTSSWEVTIISGTTRGSPVWSLENQELSLRLNLLQPDCLWRTTILNDLFSIVSGCCAGGEYFHMMLVWALLADIDNIKGSGFRNYDLKTLQDLKHLRLDPQLNDWTNSTKFWLKVFLCGSADIDVDV